MQPELNTTYHTLMARHPLIGRAMPPDIRHACNSKVAMPAARCRSNSKCYSFGGLTKRSGSGISQHKSQCSAVAAITTGGGCRRHKSHQCLSTRPSKMTTTCQCCTSCVARQMQHGTAQHRLMQMQPSLPGIRGALKHPVSYQNPQPDASLC
jgi:hypothetical protein